MPIGTWIIVGLITGLLASKLVVRSGEGLFRDMGLGVAGAVFAGWMFAILIAPDAAGLDPFGLVVMLAGAGAVLVVYHMLFPFARHG